MTLFDANVVATGKVMRSTANGFAVSIEAGCNGVEATIVLIAAILAFPASWPRKLAGLAAGIAAVQGLNVVRVISLFYLGQWSFQVFEWAHLYLWQALIMLDVLVVLLIWVRTLPRDDGGGAARRPAPRGGRGRRVRRVGRTRLPASSCACWRGCRPCSRSGFCRRRCWCGRRSSSCARSARVGMPHIVRAVEQQGATLTFATALKPGQASGGGEIAVDVNALLYAYGLPLYAALVLGTRERGWPRQLLVGYAAIVPVVAFGVLADFLKNVTITSGALVASQTGFSAWQREAIAFAFQFGSLILPTVVPAVVWVVTHRRFLESLRAKPQAAVQAGEP